MADAIVVLGYKNDADGRLHPIAQQRCEQAYQCYQQSSSPPPKLICTGGIDAKFNPTSTNHAQYLQRYLQQLGTSADDFLPQVPSRNTYEDAKLAMAVIEQADIQSVTLVTSDFHMHRARLWFALFMPKLNLHSAAATTLATELELATLQAHEVRAVAQFHRDFPEVPIRPAN